MRRAHATVGIRPRWLSSLPLRWRLALCSAALAAAVLLLLGLLLYREVDTFLVGNTEGRLRAQAQATIARHAEGVIGIGAVMQSGVVVAPPAEGATVIPAEVAGPPLTVLRLPSIAELAGLVVTELTTRDTSAVVLNAAGEVIAGGAPFVQVAAPEAPAPPPLPNDVVWMRDVPAPPSSVEVVRAAPPPPDGARIAAVADSGEEAQYIATHAGGERRLVLLFPLRRAGDRAVVGVLQVATSLQPADDVLARLRLLLLLGLGGALALSVAVGVPLTRAALRPLERLVATTERIAADDLSARSALPHGADEIGRLAAAYDRMLARLEASFRAQKQFVADAAHELRTPLTAIAGLIELLLLGVDDGDPAVRRRTLATVDRDLARLTRLVNDLLSLSRQDLAAPQEGRRVDLAALAAELRALTAELVPDRRVTLERPPGPVEVLGDPDRLRQVLLNLAENARRYTPPGASITFRVRRDGAAAEVAVIDDGPGIAPGDLPRIFDRFYRGGEARDRRSGGAGLGLAIARAIAEAHGGTLAAENAPGEGATFILRLPLAPPVRASAELPAPAFTSSTL